MEKKKTEEVVVDETKIDGTGATDEVVDEKNDEVKEELISKTKAQEMVDKALAKNLPPKEKMDAFKQWEESQKTESERQEQQRKELESLRTEATNIKRENLILKAGVSNDDSDYVLYKVGKMEGDFDENLAEFIELNPKFISKEATKPTTTGFKQTTVTPKSEKEEHLDKKYANNPWYDKK